MVFVEKSENLERANAQRQAIKAAGVRVEILNQTEKARRNPTSLWLARMGICCKYGIP
jgi:hypothetical protein